MSVFPADVHTFNCLLSTASDIQDGHNERWDLICVRSLLALCRLVRVHFCNNVGLFRHQDFLKQMNQQKVQPNLQTFNTVLKALKHSRHLARHHALQTLSEMKALGIGKYYHSYWLV